MAAPIRNAQEVKQKLSNARGQVRRVLDWAKQIDPPHETLRRQLAYAEVSLTEAIDTLAAEAEAVRSAERQSRKMVRQSLGYK